ncbi:fatty acid synthase [Cryptotermes secundus]|nr:fatty acid synthase [Cryptotermes secundus]
MVAIDVESIATDDSVVISGFSGRFPMSDNIDELRENLFSMADLVQPMEDHKWTNGKLHVPLRVGQINKKEKFDAGFFGIHRRQSTALDVMTRLILERSYEAIVDAGLNPSDLQKTNTTVVTSASISESENTWMYGDLQSGLEFLGHSRAMLANRISFWLNINASSYSLTSMETGGLEALTVAYNTIRSGRCDAALIGSISLVLLPAGSYHYKELGLLSPDGKTKSFDAAADGYARSDGVAVMLLQKAKFAKRIYATVVHSAVEICGDRMTPLITPMRDPFINLLERFYETCGVDPTSVQFLEADGSGNKAWDEEELNAVDRVFLCNRSSPLLIGSVKSNLGHANAASNFFSIAKVLIAMQTGQIPPNIHYKQPSPNIPALIKKRLKVVTEAAPWDGGLVGVNAVGMTGIYGHLLLKSYDRYTPKKKHNEEIPRLVIVSGRTHEGMEDLLCKLESMTFDVEFIRLMHDVHSSNISNHIFRGYTILPVDEKPFHEIQLVDSTKRPIWFVFSGMGSQWSGMGRDLLELPMCAKTIEKCHAILKEKGLDLKHIITTDDHSVFDCILHCFVGIAAIQLALVDALTALGVVPDGMVGHSVGELGCAYADGCFTLEEMLLAAYYRGMASIESSLITGYMAAIGLGYKEVKDMLPPEIDVACHNSEHSSTISGPVEPVKRFVAQLKEQGVFARVVNVANIAYHSRYIQPAAPALFKTLKKLIPNPKPRSVRWISTSVPEECWDTHQAKYCSADYHTNNLLHPVLFEEASRHIPRNAIVIEVAPHGLLQAILRRSLSPKCTNIALTQRAHPQGLHFLLSAIGRIYMAGALPKVSKLYPSVQFPVSRGTPSISPLVSWNHTEDWHILDDVTVVDSISGENDVTVSLSHAEDRVYAGNTINGRILYPTFAYLKVVWEILALLQRTSYTKLPVVFENVRILQHLEIPEHGALSFYVMVQQGSGEFEVSKENILIATGRVRGLKNIRNEYVRMIPALDGNGSITVNMEEVYGELEKRGYQYKGLFRGILEARLSSQGSVAKVQWSDNWVAFGESILQLVMLQSEEHSQNLCLPVALQKIVINPLEHQTETQEFEAVFHLSMGVVRCGGLEVRHVKTTCLELSSISQRNTKLETVKFLQHINPDIKNIHNFVEMCLQLAMENCYQPNRNNNMTVIELTNHQNLETFTSLLKMILSYYPQVDLKTTPADDLQHINTEERSCCCLLVVTNKNVLKDALTLLQRGFLLCSMEDKEMWPHDGSLVAVAEYCYTGRKFILLRKSYEPNEHTVHVMHPSGETSSWLDQVRVAGPCKRLYLVAEVSSHGIGMLPAFMRQLVADPELTHVRCFFLSDKAAPPFSLHKSLYSQQLLQDLVTNVYHNGDWGGFYSVSLDSACILRPQTVDSPLLSLQCIEDVQVQCLGLNPKDLDFKQSSETDKNGTLLEFSGTLTNGQRVMGVARMSQYNPIKEEYLTWNVPNSWNLKQAATVPLAYSTAYYSLVLAARMQTGETILVHTGSSNIGQAAITLALHSDCTVFTTVANQEQRAFIKCRFPQLLDCHILNLDHFDISLLMETKGKGCNVILDTVNGPDICTSIHCLAAHGRFVQLVQADLTRNKSMGMEAFLKDITVFGVVTNNLFNMPSEWKEALHFGVQDAVMRGIVQPLECAVFPRKQSQLAFRTLSDVHHMGKVLLTVSADDNAKTQQLKFRCDSQSSYLVAGGKAEECVDVAEWLVLRGACNVVIALNCRSVSNQLTRRIGLLRSYHNTHLVLVFTPAATTSTSATNLLEAATSAIGGKLGAIFILPAETTERENGITVSTVSHLDAASRGIKTLRHFVCLLAEGSWSTCEMRHHAGLPALAVHWPHSKRKGFSLRQSMQVLDALLTSEEKAVVVIVKEEKETGGSKAYTAPSLDTFLPASIEELAALGEDLAMCSSCCLKELTSLSPGKAFVKEVPSVFIIPGLQGPPSEVLKPLARQIMFPTFCVRLSHTSSSLSETAGLLAKHIREAQKKGPYNLVGVSWGGVLTLELARILETEGVETRVVLLDGALDMIRSMVDLLNQGSELEANLICRLLQISSMKVHEELMQLPDWSSRLNRALLELPSKMKSREKHLGIALTAVADHISSILQFQHPGTLLSGEVTLVRPADESEDNCGLTKFFKQTVNMKMVEGNHKTIISNRETGNIINRFVL